MAKAGAKTRGVGKMESPTEEVGKRRDISSLPINQRNLVQNRPDDFPPEKVAEFALNAGMANARAHKRRKLLADGLREILRCECLDDDLRDKLVALGLDPTFAEAINLATASRALTGDIEAARYVRDTIGEKPTAAMQIGVTSGPVQAMDMTKLSDSDLEALADRCDEPHLLGAPGEK